VRIASLGSGSRGNSFLVESQDTRLLVDAGFSASQTAARLEALDVEPETVDAVVVTHEHRDHTAGIGVAARRWGWPLHMTRRTATACSGLLRGEEVVHLFDGGASFPVGSLTVKPFLTCHDAAEPVAVTVVEPSSQLKIGVATDLGRATATVRSALRGAHFLVLEANHDEHLLRAGPYPWSLKQRIGGSRGHLSNRLAADLAAELVHPDLTGVLLAHLSAECNEPRLALAEVGERLQAVGFEGVVEVAEQDRPSRFFELGELLSDLADGPQLRLFGWP
jgi:phosphoribosyl 1,2-cyclic phosphodiesterase